MADYAIGDVQGCYEPLMRLLSHIEFNDKVDRLWFVGDLVNRGPQSLEVLRFIKQLTKPARITLGNHDIHLLAKLFGGHTWSNQDDTLQAFLQAEDAYQLGHWLRCQSILYHDTDLNIVMCHAGIAPSWDLSKAKACASELEITLAGDNYRDYLAQVYGNQPNYWSEKLTGIERLRSITNYFTRMRFCDGEGHLLFDYKGSLNKAPTGIYPWYNVPERIELMPDIVFGHWAALQGVSPSNTIHAIDTGCLWGGKLTALRLQDRRRFSVAGLSKS